MADLPINRNYLVEKMKPEVAILWKSRQLEELQLTVRAAKEDLRKFESDIEAMRLKLEHMEKVQRLDKQIHIKRIEADLEYLKSDEGKIINVE